MPISIKEISTATLEFAIATAIANLTAKDCSVSIKELTYDSDQLISGQSFSFSVSASLNPKKGGEKPPF